VHKTVCSQRIDMRIASSFPVSLPFCHVSVRCGTRTLAFALPHPDHGDAVSVAQHNVPRNVRTYTHRGRNVPSSQMAETHCLRCSHAETETKFSLSGI